MRSKIVSCIFEGEVEAWTLTLKIATCNFQSAMKNDDKDPARPFSAFMSVHEFLNPKGGSKTFV